MKYVNIILSSFIIILMVILIITGFLLYNNTNEIIKQNKNIENIMDETNRKYNYCGWYEDFYYDNAQYFGAFE